MLYLIVLYAMLADPVYKTREAATDSLKVLVNREPWLYGARLIELSAGAGPEVQARLRGPIAAYHRWRIASYVPKGVPVWPCCDFAPFPTHLGDVRCRVLGMEWYWCQGRCDVGCESGPYWHRYRAGTERMIRGMIRNGATPEACDDLLQRMWKLEQAARGDCGELWAISENWKAWNGGYPRPPEGLKP